MRRILIVLLVLAGIPVWAARSRCGPGGVARLAAGRVAPIRPVTAAAYKEPTTIEELLPPAETIKIAADPKADLKEWLKNPTITAMEYNVENLTTSVGSYKPDPVTGVRVQLAPGDVKPAWKRKIVADMIGRDKPTIATLVEVEGQEAAEEFCRVDLKGEYIPVFIKGNDTRGGPGIHVAVIVKKGLPIEFEYSSHRDEPFQDPNYPHLTKVFSRDVTALVARVPGHDKPLFVWMSGHGKSKRTETNVDPESNSIREAQARRSALLVQYYEKKYKDTPVFFAADFNDAVNTASSYQPLRDAGMKDTFDMQKKPVPIGDPSRITHTFHPLVGAPGHKVEGPAQKAQLDAVLANAAAAGLVVDTMVRRYLGPNGEELPPPNSHADRDKQGSDHAPVLLTLDQQGLLRKAGYPLP